MGCYRRMSPFSRCFRTNSLQEQAVGEVQKGLVLGVSKSLEERHPIVSQAVSPRLAAKACPVVEPRVVPRPFRRPDSGKVLERPHSVPSCFDTLQSDFCIKTNGFPQKPRSQHANHRKISRLRGSTSARMQHSWQNEVGFKKIEPPRMCPQSTGAKFGAD